MFETSEEKIKMIIDLTDEGRSREDIRKATGCAIGTIAKYQHLNGRSANGGAKGGAISKKILIPPTFGSEEKRIEEKTVSTIICEQKIQIAGVHTGYKYNLDSTKDVVTVEGDGIVAEIKIDDLVKLSNELLEVNDFADKLRKNRYSI